MRGVSSNSWEASRTIRMMETNSVRMIYKRLLIQALHLSMLKTEVTAHSSNSSKWWWDRKLSKILIKWVPNNSTLMQVLKKLVTFHLPLSSHRRKRKRRRKRSLLPPHNSRWWPAISKTVTQTMAWPNSTKLKVKVNGLASLKNKNANWLKFKKNRDSSLNRRRNFCSKNSSSKEECKRNWNVKRRRKLRSKPV